MFPLVASETQTLGCSWYFKHFVCSQKKGGGDSVDYLNLFCFYAGLDRDLSFCGFRCIKHGL